MTIYTPSQVEKKPEKGSTEPEVVTEPLTSFKDEEDGMDVSARPPLVNYFQKRRRTFCIHLLLTIFILVILACGAIGAVVFYRHLNKKVYTGVCGNFYIGGDDTLNEPQKFVQEEVKVTGQLEELQVPRFEEVKPNVVLHDFYRNYTTIVDAESHNCYVMKLNRSLIAPPKDLIDLMEKLMAGYYQTKAKVIRENYRPVLPAVNDPIIFGSDINSKCYKYNTYRLEKYVPGVVKRSIKEITEDISTYAVLSHNLDNPILMKVVVHEIKETLVDQAA